MSNLQLGLRRQGVARRGRTLDHRLATAFPVFFPIFFVGLWLVAGTVLGASSGWFFLARLYPDRPEPPLLKMGFQSGVMGSVGMGVGMNGILVFSACRSGLRVAIWRVFGPFSRPFLVPWTEISVRPRQIFFHPYARLAFGQPEAGVLSIDRAVWARLVRSASEAAGSAVAESLPAVSERRLLGAYVMQWLSLTAVAAALFILVTRISGSGGAHVPLAVCIGLPATALGAAQVIRYLVQQPR